MAPPKNKLLEGPILRSLLLLAFPIMAATCCRSAYQLIDAFWVGRLGGAAVAAVSVSFPVMFLMIRIGMGLSIAGLDPDRAVCRRAQRDAWSITSPGQTLLMVALVSLMLGAARLLIAPELLALMDVAPDVYHGALGFMRVSFARRCSSPSPISSSSRSCAASASRSCRSTSSLGTVLLNFVLNPLLIFGWDPVPGYRRVGATMTTVHLGQVIAAIVGIAVLRPAARHPCSSCAISSPTSPSFCAPSSLAIPHHRRCRRARWASWS